MADKELEEFHILRVTGQGASQGTDVVVREFPLTIILNDRELLTLLCSPTNLEYLAVGFLLSEGLIKGKDEIRKIITDEPRGVVRVKTRQDSEFVDDFSFKRLITSSCGGGASIYRATDARGQLKVESQIGISAVDIFALVREFQHSSQIFRASGGVHSAALCDTKSILLFSEDIGRHNAIDKIFGECILRDIPTDERIVVTSGRISSEILLKVAKRNIPVLISKSAPTNLGVKLASDFGVTLIGFVRGERMNVYANGWRVPTDGK